MTKLGDVPCGPCRACCRSELIVLIPEDGDDVESYDHEMVFINGAGEMPFLKHRKNGDCVYLDRDGCTIHERRPSLCRIFDCRAFYLSKTREQRQEHRKAGATARAVLNAGRERVKTLDIRDMRKVPTP
jgi:Fe-S-cluster containining protein